MERETVISCRGVGKVFRAIERGPGLRGLLKAFVSRTVREMKALDGIDLEIRAGEMIGLIGANGAGKTTLVKVLTGIVPASDGEAELFGRDCFSLRDEDKQRLSLVMGQRSQLWWDIPAMDSFRLLREIYAVDREVFDERVRAYSERLEVADRLQVPLRQLSLGQRMKMEIIGAFLHDPEVCFLDEPTIGLDLVSQETIRAFLRELNRERSVTVVLTSHDMADIEQVCRRILILDAGRLLFDGDLVDLQRRLIGRRAVEVHLEPHSAPWGEEGRRLLAEHEGRLVRQDELSLAFLLPSARTQSFIQGLFGLCEIRDLEIERQPLQDLIKQVFRGGRLEDEDA